MAVLMSNGAIFSFFRAVPEVSTFDVIEQPKVIHQWLSLWWDSANSMRQTLNPPTLTGTLTLKLYRWHTCTMHWTLLTFLVSVLSNSQLTSTVHASVALTNVMITYITIYTASCAAWVYCSETREAVLKSSQGFIQDFILGGRKFLGVWPCGVLCTPPS